MKTRLAERREGRCYRDFSQEYRLRLRADFADLVRETGVGIPRAATGAMLKGYRGRNFWIVTEIWLTEASRPDFPTAVFVKIFG